MIVNNVNPGKTNFGAKPLYNVKLKQLKNDDTVPLRATFSKISPKNKEDYHAMASIACNWNERINGLNYTPFIFEDFMGSGESLEKYYIVELVDKDKRLAERIKSVIEISNPRDIYKDNVEVYFLQTSPDNIFYDKIKGGGELALYGAVRLASRFKKSKLILTAARFAMGFYKKVGLNRAFSDNRKSSDIIFELPSDKYGYFMKNVESRYEFGEFNVK